MFSLKHTNKWISRISLTALFGVLSIGAWAQSMNISGSVKDGNGPLVGVTIILKDSPGVGTVSDAKGEYNIRAPKDGTLVFSFLGMTPIELPINGRSHIDVTMKSEATELEDVVVIGYGSLQKKEVTSAISSISGDDLVPGVGGATIVNAMKGKISGLTMSTTDSPNAGADIQLRGMASVNTSRGPLVVIDGMPGGDISSLAPEDIQSIDVLKDASAGAIYGTRATGGVIMVTTKRAQAGTIKVSYTAEGRYRQAFGKPEMMTAKEYLRNFPTAKDFGSQVDWWDEGMADNPLSHKHILSVQGGVENARIYTTVMYESNNGILVGDKREDFSGRINANFKALAGWIDFNTYVDYRQADRDKSTPAVNTLLALNPTRNPYSETSGTGYNIWTDGSDTPNAIGDAALNTRNALDKWFSPKAELIVNILPVKGLTLHATVGYDHQQTETHEYDSRFSTAELRAGRTGSAYLGFYKLDNINSDAYISYNNNFKGHNINAVAGVSYFKSNSEQFSMRNYNFSVDGTKYWNMQDGSYLKEGDAEMSSKKGITEKLAGYFARVNYNWQGKYMASASIRYEGSSKFGEDKRYGTFWSLSGGWRISDENFMKGASWIDDLKIRIGYGETGNQGFDPTYAAVMYSPDLYWMMPDGKWNAAYTTYQNTNLALGWEEKHEWNVGIDYSFFDNRLFGKLDFYRRKVVDLIHNATVSQPPYVHSTMYQNIGVLENKGVEFEIGGEIVRTKNWNYSTSINLSHNKTTVGEVMGENTYLESGYIYPENTHRFEVGVTVGSFFLHEHAGFAPNADNTGEDFRIKDVDGNPVSANMGTDEDKKYFGNYIPKIIAGWNHNLRYKNLTFSMTITSWIDFDIFNAINFYNGYAPRIAGQNPNNKLKVAFTDNKNIRPDGNLPISNYFLEDGTFLKIQNISLGYRLPLKTKVIESLRFYFTVDNVCTLTKYTGINPEVNISGWENGIEDNPYPMTRSYALGVQFNF